MYCYDFICTYHLITDDNEISDALYKLQFLEAFSLIDWDDKVINETLSHIYNCIKDDEQFNNILDCFKQTKKIFVDEKEDKEKIFVWLFNYDHFYLIHRCLIDYFTNKCISEINYDKIMNKIKT